MFERCRPPIMPSETTADSSDSMAPSRAIVIAGCTSSRSVSHETRGTWGEGIAAWISPNRLPIVSTGRSASRTTSVVTTSATKGDGIRRLTLGKSWMIASASAATPIAHRLTVWRFAK